MHKQVLKGNKYKFRNIIYSLGASMEKMEQQLRDIGQNRRVFFYEIQFYDKHQQQERKLTWKFVIKFFEHYRSYVVKRKWNYLFKEIIVSKIKELNKLKRQQRFSQEIKTSTEPPHKKKEN